MLGTSWISIYSDKMFNNSESFCVLFVNFNLSDPDCGMLENTPKCFVFSVVRVETACLHRASTKKNEHNPKMRRTVTL